MLLNTPKIVDLFLPCQKINDAYRDGLHESILIMIEGGGDDI